MTDETNSTPATASEKPAALTVAQERMVAIKAYHEADTREAKAAVVKQYPILETIYSAGNHN